eukprot:m.162934 g.162934  ORF g.162934 m.162934 type:complete len:910 (-) comp16545_c0_seq2:63-2792(-)
MALEEHDVVILVDAQAGCSAAALANWTLLHLTRPNVTVQWHYELTNVLQPHQQKSARSKRVSLQPFSPASFNSYCSAIASLSPTPSPSANPTVLIATLRQLLLEHLSNIGWSPILSKAARHQFYIVLALPDDREGEDGTTGLPQVLLDSGMVKQLKDHHVCLHIINTNPQAEDSAFASWLNSQLQAADGCLFHLSLLDLGTDLHHDGCALQLPMPSTAPVNAVRRSKSAKKTLRHDPRLISQRWRAVQASAACQPMLATEESTCCGKITLVPLRNSKPAQRRLTNLASLADPTLVLKGCIPSTTLSTHMDFSAGLLLRASCAAHAERESSSWLQLLLECQQTQGAVLCQLDGPCVLLPMSINTAACYTLLEPLPATLPLPEFSSVCDCQGQLPARGLHTYLPTLNTVATDDAFDCADDDVRQTVMDLHHESRALEKIRWLSPSLLTQSLSISTSLDISRQRWQQRASRLQREAPATNDFESLPIPTLTVSQAYDQCQNMLTALHAAPKPNLEQLTDGIAIGLTSLTSGSEQCKLLLRLAQNLQASLANLTAALKRPFTSERAALPLAKSKSKRSKRKLPSAKRAQVATRSEEDVMSTSTSDNVALEDTVRAAQLQVYTRCELLLHLATNPELKRLRLPANLLSNGDGMSDDSEASVVDAAYVKDQLSSGLLLLFQNLQPVEPLVTTGIAHFNRELKGRFKQEIPGTWRSLCHAAELPDSDIDEEPAINSQPTTQKEIEEPVLTIPVAAAQTDPSAAVPGNFAKPKPVEGARVRRPDETNHRKQITLAKPKKSKDSKRKDRGRSKGKRVVHQLVMDTPAREVTTATMHFKRNKKVAKVVDDEEIPETPGYSSTNTGTVRRSARLTPSSLRPSTAAEGSQSSQHAERANEDAPVTPKRKHAKRALSAFYRD